MIDRRRLEELDTLRLTKRNLDTCEIGDMFMTLRALWSVAEAAERIIRPPESFYSPRSRKGKLKAALDALKEPSKQDQSADLK